MAIRRDRKEGRGGGCVTFVKQAIPYRVLGIGKEMECAVKVVLVERKELVVVNYYRPCLKLELNKLEEIEGQDRTSIVWCGDFTHIQGE